jgi:hypothetical protein
LAARCSIWAGLERGRQPQHQALGACGDGVEALASVFEQGAGLCRADRTGCQLLCFLQQQHEPGQFVGAVPLREFVELAAQARRLGVREVDVGVDPPVGEVGQLAVAELDQAARGQQQAGHAQTDNPQKPGKNLHVRILDKPRPPLHQPPLDVVIMAAGKGTRMKSRLPKVLHRLAGRALAAARDRHGRRVERPLLRGHHRPWCS